MEGGGVEEGKLTAGHRVPCEHRNRRAASLRRTGPKPAVLSFPRPPSSDCQATHTECKLLRIHLSCKCYVVRKVPHPMTEA